jgi:hypothetical protein
VKQYETIATQVAQFAKVANDKAREGWRVISVLPENNAPRDKLEDIVIFIEREAY